MPLRTNRFLRSIAALLFLFELLSPVLTARAQSLNKEAGQSLTNGIHQNGFPFIFFMEQVEENEESVESDKLASPQLSTEPEVLSARNLRSAKLPSSHSIKTSDLINSHQPIFRLNCTLLL